MTTELEKKLTVIETLYSEQEYTVQTLNSIVTRQDQEISRLSNELQWLKQQLMTLKEHLPNQENIDTDERPPHY